MARKSDRLNTAAVNALRQWLRDHGVPAATASAIAKTTRTYGEISDDLRQWLRQRPKAQN